VRPGDYFGLALISGSIAALYSELFDASIRYTGLVFAREASGAGIGGFTPLFADRPCYGAAAKAGRSPST